MSGIAEVLVNLGYPVSGSDVASNPATRRLKKLSLKPRQTMRRLMKPKRQQKARRMVLANRLKHVAPEEIDHESLFTQA